LKQHPFLGDITFKKNYLLSETIIESYEWAGVRKTEVICVVYKKASFRVWEGRIMGWVRDTPTDAAAVFDGTDGGGGRAPWKRRKKGQIAKLEQLGVRSWDPSLCGRGWFFW